MIGFLLATAGAGYAYTVTIEDSSGGSISQGTFGHTYRWYTDNPTGQPNCDVIEVKPAAAGGAVVRSSNGWVDNYPPYKDGPLVSGWGYNPPTGTYGLKITDHNAGTVLATAFVYYDSTTGVSTPTDASGVPATQPVSGGGGSCRVWATRSGNVGTIHVDQVTLPSGDTSWSFMYKSTSYVYAPMTLPKNAITQDFNLSGLPDGTAEYVRVSFTDSSGFHVIFEGNVMFPNAASSGGTTTAPAPVSSDTNNTYQPGGPGDPTGGPSTQPVNGPVTTTTGGPGGGGIGTSGNGFGTDSVWTESQPEAPTTQPGTGTGTSTSGESMDSRIARYKQTFVDAFNANIGGINTHGPVDKVVSVNPGAIGGVSLAFAIHTVPDTSTVMGAALDSIRLSMRAFLSVFVAYTLFQQCVRICRRL